MSVPIQHFLIMFDHKAGCLLGVEYDKDPASAEYVFVVAVDEGGRTVGAPRRLRR